MNWLSKCLKVLGTLLKHLAIGGVLKSLSSTLDLMNETALLNVHLCLVGFVACLCVYKDCQDDNTCC